MTADDITQAVMPGLGPGTHDHHRGRAVFMDCRDKPGNDKGSGPAGRMGDVPARAIDDIAQAVMPGLGPGIHDHHRGRAVFMDCRDKPGNDKGSGPAGRMGDVPARAIDDIAQAVMPGLGPGIHDHHRGRAVFMDCRDKPGNDKGSGPVGRTEDGGRHDLLRVYACEPSSRDALHRRDQRFDPPGLGAPEWRG